MAAINGHIAKRMLGSVRQAAIERIRFFQEKLAERGILTRMGGELEFFPLNKAGVPQKDLIDEDMLTEYLNKNVRGIEHVHREIASSKAQYEMVTGPNAAAGGTMADATPLATAENIAAFKDAFEANAPRWGLGGASFKARMQSGTILENSGLHINTSLWDKAGKSNLFYQRGSATSDLERHVVDALIKTHGDAGLAYFPNVESFERIGSTSRTKLASIQSVEDTASLVPSRAGYMSNKGMTLGNIANMTLGWVMGKPPIASVTGRHRSIANMPLGLFERIVFNGKRASMVGFEKPHQYRLESRLGGADADPYVAVAAEMASVYDAVMHHTHALDDARPIKNAVEKIIDTGSTRFRVDKHGTKFDSIPLATDVATAQERLSKSGRMRELLGEDLYHGVMEHSIAPGQEMTDALRESQSHVEKYMRGRAHETTHITSDVHEALNSMPSPVRPEGGDASWVDKISESIMGARRRG